MYNELFRMIYPRKCPGCGDVISPEMLVCGRCSDSFRPVRGPHCFKCGRQLEDETGEYCDECTGKGHHYSVGFSALMYDGATRKAMSDLKFGGLAENADFFAAKAYELCSERVRAFAPDIMVPVPIHPSKMRKRGYNQAQLITDRLSVILGIGAVNDLLLRTKKTRAQKLLDAGSRTDNLRDAFTCDLSRYSHDLISGRFRKVLLVDDIYTTGATMECCTNALLEAGVSTVGILSAAMGCTY